MFLYQKVIDRSTLRQGFQIPVEYHALLDLMPGGMLAHGETRAIKLLIDGIEYDAQLKNQVFDKEVYSNHADVIQVRYSENSPLSKRLREIFSSSWNYVEQIKALPENQNKKLVIKVPEEMQEYLAISFTELPNVFVAECITNQQKADIVDYVQKYDELDFETSFVLREDTTATIKEVNRMQKIRQLDRSIGDSLKRLYDFRCQMTGEKIGDAYKALVVEAHHIVPFTQSMNNDTSNIIILSPNYHRIIHKAKPEFDRDNLQFVFANGLKEKVMINKHL